VPGIIGQVAVLTVRDAGRSAAWYCELLGTEKPAVMFSRTVVSRWLTSPRRAVAWSYALSAMTRTRVPSTSSAPDWITWNSWLPSAAILTRGLVAWSSWGYPTPASKNRLTPQMRCSPSATRTTSSSSSSGERLCHDQQAGYTSLFVAGLGCRALWLGDVVHSGPAAHPGCDGSSRV